TFYVNQDLEKEVLQSPTQTQCQIHLAAQAGVRYAMVNPDSYVKSNIDGFVNLLEMVKSLNPQPAVVWASRIINLGNTSPVSVNKLVSILEKLLKVKAKKKVVLMPGNGDVPFTHANISLARKELGYRPTTDLETGLKKFVKWYLEYYGGKKKSSY
nr:UDP-glucuronate 4-epimerase 1 [Tanacetum cinerariifolium]